jgi:hypothetical protein
MVDMTKVVPFMSKTYSKFTTNVVVHRKFN